MTSENKTHEAAERLKLWDNGLAPSQIQDINDSERSELEKQSDAVKLIADERSRQQSQEGWTIEHDDCHECGELAQAAACYAIGKRIKYFNGWISFHGNGEEPRLTKLWPWGDDWWKPSAGDRIRDLVKAGALIVAEIERLQRKELQQKGGNA